MKIIKLDENFKMNFSSLINENSEAGIKQAIYEILKYEKYFDVYNYEVGIDYANYFNSQNIDDKQQAISILQENITQEILNIPYVTDVTHLDIKKNNNDIIITLFVKYIDNNNIKDITISVNQNGFR